MRLHLKSQRGIRFSMDFDMTKSIGQLKQELALNENIGLTADMQSLFHNGQTLDDDAKSLESYNINAQKLIIVLEKKSPHNSPSLPDEQSPLLDECAGGVDLATQAMIESFGELGFEEDQVRRALNATDNNPDLAINLLEDGWASSGHHFFSLEEWSDSEGSSMDVARCDPILTQAHQAIIHQPDVVDDFIEETANAHQNVLSLITTHQHDFLRLLLEIDDIDDN